MEYRCTKCGKSFLREYILLKHLDKPCIDKKPVSDVNGSQYSVIRKKIISLYDIYDIDDIDRINIDVKYMNMSQLNVFIDQISTLDVDNKHYKNYQSCVIEQMTCFLIYPRAKSDKHLLMRKITNYIKTCGLINSYDIVKQYDSINKYALADDIIVLFDSNVENILLFVKSLKHNKNICEILNDLYDNNIVRILFENDDIQEIIFNNYKTINISILEKHIPFDATIKTIFNILSLPNPDTKSTTHPKDTKSTTHSKDNKSTIHSKDNKITTYPQINEEEIQLLAKYMFTYSSDDKILKLLKYYKITINDNLINYYAFNEKWSMKMFDHLVKNGAKPNLNTLLLAVEHNLKTDAKSIHLFDMLKKSVNDLLK